MSDHFDDDDSSHVRVEIKKRSYPLPPAGERKALCIKAEAVPNPFEDAEAGSKVLKLHFQLDDTYVDPEDKEKKERNHRVFSKPYSFSFGPKAGLAKLCVALTGKPPVFRKTKDGNKEYADFDYKQFENMRCSVYIKHVESNGKTFANILDYIATPEQQKDNCALLPPEDVAAQKAEEKASSKKEAKEAEVVATVDTKAEESSYAKAARMIAEAKTIEEVDNVFTMVIDGSFQGDELNALNAEIDKRKKELSA